MIEYYETVLEVIEDSLKSIPADTYEQIICECVDTLKNGGKIVYLVIISCIRVTLLCQEFLVVQQSYELLKHN